MAGHPTPIRYVFPVSKMIEFAKSWVPKSAAFAFDDGGFLVSKYSKKQASISSSDIKAQAKDDAKDYTAFVEAGLLSAGVEAKLIKKALAELPTADDLANIVLSYTIYNTEDRKRVRVPPSAAIRSYDYDIAHKKSNNKNIVS
jgi:hypothetical protein